MRCASAFTLTKGTRKIMRKLSESIVSLEANVDAFSPVYVPKIGMAKDLIWMISETTGISDTTASSVVAH